MIPLSKMILWAMIWHKEGRASREPSIYKKIFPIGYREISKTRVMEHHSISHRPFPATLDVEKSHVEITYSEGVGGETTTVIVQGVLIFGRGVDIEVRAVNGSKGVLKKWEKLAVIEDIIRYRVTNFGWFDLSRGDERIMRNIYKIYD